MTEYQELFAQEAAELFSCAYDCLLSAEENDFLDRAGVAELFRVLHTLKGGGGSVDLDRLSRYAHKIENLLSDLRDGKIAYRKGMAGFFMDSVDRLQEIMSAELNGAIDEADFEEKLKLLDARVSEFRGEGTPIAAALPKTDAGDDGFMLFTPEQIAALEAQEAQSGGLEASPRPPETPAISIRSETRPREEERKQEPAKSSGIRVDLDKIDRLLDYVSELVLTNSVLARFAERLSSRSEREELEERLSHLTRHIRGLQDSVMAVRMIPLDHVYAKLPKVVRDLSKKLGKKARLSYSGGGGEIDRLMIEGLTDPLNHIIRNAIDHGIESAEEREALGKDAVAVVEIAAAQENGQVVISISDDGRGINSEAVAKKAVENNLISAEQAAKMSDDEKNNLIFLAGLTTAKKVTDISGRGVGMDVVRSNIAKLGGFVRVRSERSAGSRISIALPLTLAILEGLDVNVGDRLYILPLSSVIESLQPKETMIQTNGGGGRMFLALRGEFIPIITLYSLFDIEPKRKVFSKGILIVARAGEEKVALFADSFGAQRQVVVKSLDKNFRRVPGVSGVTVQGDGTVVLILDPIGLVEKEREISDRGRAEFRAETKRPQSRSREPGFDGSREFLIFRMFGLLYGILLKSISKIITYDVKITPLPFLPHWVLGVLNSRGEIMPVIDLRLKFTNTRLIYDEETIILALKFPNDRVMAIAVDSIETIAELDRKDIQNPADIGGGIEARFLDGLARINDEMVSVINIYEMLNIDEI